ncbi:16S rRNA (cytidine(1402)-2'-O)-methyltransferase [Paenibacillus hexagrammi]|uniref:Ribosomal RNA small subunit methyltransferase I n=1 Tax=Paenibacillus hexagrammi TaxID=2908839 RepID=A0ABY3SJ20_9BACL|nr:16S rRNA (cytidine(1402)-2'-O)-methyltransferase [Paenibacillus sp. YPD9-1]UJF33136.1 16S rRNA (cytidine(1402)-2'-O)-methyltransferase [Paenibacillus sp. YPD9-1]
MTIQVQKSYAEGRGAGTLYLVATPIGNLEDMTFRAIRTLKEVELIAAEDTRQTRKLLTHFEVATRLVSYHEHNKQASGPELIRLLLEGRSIALVSDAGLPAISDPGYDLVRMAVEQDVPVVPIPGANAALSALIASSLPTDRFTFVGFLPREKKDQTKVLQGLQQTQGTLLFYESPHRVEKTLGRMAEVWGGGRRVCLARELTKRYEEFVRGTIEECLEHLSQYPPQGEYCIIAEGESAAAASAAGGAGAWWAQLSLGEHVEHYEAQGNERKEAMKLTAIDRGLSKRDVYNALIER